MNKYIVGALIAFVAIVGFSVVQSSPSPENSNTQFVDADMVLYKSPSCGCCGVYASYINGKGYDVETEMITDMTTIKNELGIPHELASCHTMEVDGYVVEGHIPEEAIVALLTERPDIKGIALPGMPAGSPGMPGPKTEDFVIYEITHDGGVGDVFMTI